MQFRHPEILYFLFLLIIPVIVHLFQLRRFKKQYFTNVRLLQELSIQTRKSSKIKKWLLLATRLLLLAAIIIGFAQPFFDAPDKSGKSNELFILLDNSFSMQAKGQKGELMRRSVEDLLEQVPEDATFSLLTADGQFWNTDIKSISRDLQKLNYSAQPFDLGNLMARVKSRQSPKGKDIVIITDAAGIDTKPLSGLNEGDRVDFILQKAESKDNVSIDSVYLNQTLDNFYEIGLKLKASEAKERDVPVSVTNKGKLLAKTVVHMTEGEKEQLFMIPREDFIGSATIEDQGLAYDNEYFFSLSAPKKIRVFSIGSTADAGFLSRIYTGSEFEFKNAELPVLDYGLIEKQDAIVLNGLKEIPQALTSTLSDFYKKGGNIVLIPSAESTVENLNAFASVFGKAKFSTASEQEKLITKISYDHPLFAGVFEKKTDNFQYPKSKSALTLSAAAPSVLQFQDGSAFLTSFGNGVSNLFVFGGPIDKAHSNFTQSPLVVPTFYNMARNIQRTGIVALPVGKQATFMADARIGKDAVLQIKSGSESFIPAQQALGDKVKMTFADAPTVAGNFGIFDKSEEIGNLSFNYPRSESLLEPTDLGNFNTSDNISLLLDSMKQERTQTELWKIFAAVALLLLLLELLIQKFVK